MLWIVFTARSQDTTDNRPVTFPFWMAREIALDLEEKSRLELEANISAMEISALNNLVAGLEKINSERLLQLDLVKDNSLLMELQLLSYRSAKPKNNTINWWLRLLGAFGLGYLIGKI